MKKILLPLIFLASGAFVTSVFAADDYTPPVRTSTVMQIGVKNVIIDNDNTDIKITFGLAEYAEVTVTNVSGVVYHNNLNVNAGTVLTIQADEGTYTVTVKLSNGEHYEKTLTI